VRIDSGNPRFIDCNFTKNEAVGAGGERERERDRGTEGQRVRE